MGTPMTGRVVWDATTPRQGRRAARRRDEHLNPGGGRGLHVVLDLLGIAMSGCDDELGLDAKLVERLLGVFHNGLIGCAANDDADLRHGKLLVGE